MSGSGFSRVMVERSSLGAGSGNASADLRVGLHFLDEVRPIRELAMWLSVGSGEAPGTNSWGSLRLQRMPPVRFRIRMARFWPMYLLTVNMSSLKLTDKEN